jgi:hypothetical protein
MAVKIFKIGGKVRLIKDGTDLDFIPVRDFDFEPEAAQVVITNSGLREFREYFLYSDIQDEAGASVGDRESIITYLSDFVGFNNGGDSGNGAEDYGHVTGITTQVIPSSTGINLTTYWNGTPTLSGGVSFASGVFTVATAGFYQITGGFSFQTNGAGARSANIIVNNSALVGYQNMAPVSNDRTGMNFSAGIYLNSGDNVRILAYQGSGVTLVTDGAIGGNFSITKTVN